MALEKWWRTLQMKYGDGDFLIKFEGFNGFGVKKNKGNYDLFT
jgi:hypothetical protein